MCDVRVMCVSGGSRVGAGVLEDLQHAGAGDVPDLRTELLPVQNHQVLQTVGPRPGQLLVICSTEEPIRERLGFSTEQRARLKDERRDKHADGWIYGYLWTDE